VIEFKSCLITAISDGKLCKVTTGQPSLRQRCIQVKRRGITIEFSICIQPSLLYVVFLITSYNPHHAKEKAHLRRIIPEIPNKNNTFRKPRWYFAYFQYAIQIFRLKKHTEEKSTPEVKKKTPSKAEITQSNKNPN
jgi:hypothetical protein